MNNKDYVMDKIEKMSKDEFVTFAFQYLGEDDIYEWIKNSLDSDESGEATEIAKDIIDNLIEEETNE
jgi:undecaprenyl pyrophosphate synthase